MASSLQGGSSLQHRTARWTMLPVAQPSSPSSPSTCASARLACRSSRGSGPLATSCQCPVPSSSVHSCRPLLRGARFRTHSTQQETDQQTTDGSTTTTTTTSPDPPSSSNGSQDSSAPAPSAAPAAAAEESPAASTSQPQTPQQERRETLSRTMAGLDALLGIVDEPPKGSGVSPDALKKQLADAEAKSLSSDPSQTAGQLKDAGLESQFAKIMEQARKLAESNEGTKGLNSEVEQEKLRTEFESLMKTLNKPSTVETVSKEDIKKLREQVFGPLTFWVTEVVPLVETERTGVIVRGNLRDERVKVFEILRTKLSALFPGKYAAFMVEDVDLDEAAGGATPTPASQAAGTKIEAGPRVAFQIVPAEQAVPPQQEGWKQGVALATVLLLAGACVSLGLAANSGKLPQETIDYLNNPDAYNLPDGAVPPGLENWDPEGYFNTAFPIGTSLVAVNGMHEFGHRIAAYWRQVKLGPSFFIPNLQIGSFGAITPIVSMLKGRSDLWDVAAAGPLGGMAMSVALLGIGLAGSHAGVDKDLLVSVPSTVFQGSLLLGTVARTVLGDDALRATQVLVSPLAVAGWCGVVSNALQLLPVGSLDGGRMVQAAWGKQALALTSFFTYLGLGLGLLGSSLSLPFGLYVIICQREAEAYIQDTVTPAGSTRQTATAVAVLAAVLVLLPFAPELAESMGVGAANPFQ